MVKKTSTSDLLHAIIYVISVSYTHLRINNGVFNDYNPYTTPVYGDWYFAKDEKHTDCVYLNDQAMYEVDSIEACEKAEVYKPSWEQEWSVYKWYALSLIHIFFPS